MNFEYGYQLKLEAKALLCDFINFDTIKQMNFKLRLANSLFKCLNKDLNVLV